MSANVSFCEGVQRAVGAEQLPSCDEGSAGGSVLPISLSVLSKTRQSGHSESPKTTPTWCILRTMVKMPPRTAVVALCWALQLPPFAQALENGVGRTPALGWSSWNYFKS